MNMEHGTGMFIIAAACGAVLLIGVMKQRMEWLLNIAMRSILGTIVMYFVNYVLKTAGIILGIGINPVTVLTCGILGFPGILGLYALGIYKFL